MKIIDSHIHIYDIYNGFKIIKPRNKLPYGLINILEWRGFKRPGGQKKQSNRLIGDIVFYECCKRTEFCEPELYIKEFKNNNIVKSIIMPIEPFVKTIQTLKVCKKHKEFITFASVDFLKENYIDDLHNYMKLGCKGLKIHPVIQQILPSDKRILNLLEEYQKYNLPACIHVGPCRAGFSEIEAEKYAYPNQVIKLIKLFPKINFIFAHMGLQFYKEVLEYAYKYENIYLDTSFQPIEILKKAENMVGSERIIFGSDFPLLSQKSVIRIIKKSFQKNSLKLENILYNNINRLIKL